MKRLIVIVPLGVLGALLLIGAGFLLGAGPLGKAVMRPTLSEREAIALVNRYLNDQIDSALGEIRRLQAGCPLSLGISSSFSFSLNKMRPSITATQSATYQGGGSWLVIGPEDTSWRVLEATSLVEPVNGAAWKYLADIRDGLSRLSIFAAQACR